MDDKIYVEADNSIWKLIDGQDDPILLTAANDPNNIVNEEIEEED